MNGQPFRHRTLEGGTYSKRRCPRKLCGLLCFGDRLLLAALALGQIFQDGLIGACTTEQEALAHAAQAPDLVLVTEDLEQGYGISLDQCICLLFSSGAEALDAGAQGVIFVSSLGSGDGDFMKAIARTLEGGTYFPGPVRDAAAFHPGDSAEGLEALDQLSSREQEVLQALSQPGDCPAAVHLTGNGEDPRQHRDWQVGGA